MPLTYNTAHEVIPSQEAKTVDLYRVVIDVDRKVIQYRYRSKDTAGNVIDTRNVDVAFTSAMNGTIQALTTDGFSKQPYGGTGTVS